LRELSFKGIKVHNLKNIDIAIPLGSISVVTGLSGSGKSSLVFDTIYAESSRRFIESLGAFSRIFLPQLASPDIESAENIPPAIAVRYLPLSRSSRSTVGTSTEIYDYIRLLFANLGNIWCPECNIPIEPVSPSSAAERIINEFEGKAVMITFPLSIEGKNWKEIKNELLAKGYYRIWNENAIVETAQLKTRGENINLSVVTDRLIAKEKERTRLAEAVESAYKEGNGCCKVYQQDSDSATLSLTEGRTCVQCGRSFPLPTPGMFSFNSAQGACPECRGFGDIITYSPDKIIPDKSKTFKEGAVPVLELNRFAYKKYHMNELLRRNRIPVDIPVSFLPPRALDIIWNGDDQGEGLLGFFKSLEKKRYRVDIRAILAKYRSYMLCPACKGSRLRGDALDVRLERLSIGEVVKMPFTDLLVYVNDILSGRQSNKAAMEILEQIISRLEMIVKVGVGYLTLNRMTRTLSRGELQRINLINAAGARLTGTLYLMDEPSVGLHPMDEEGLTDVIIELKKRGNTVIVAEHSPAIIRMADYIVELGPKAGADGGEVVFSGCREDFFRKDTITSRYANGSRILDIPPFRRSGFERFIEISGAKAHNLKNIDARIPVGAFTCITGPSGAGKSSLMLNVLFEGWKKNENRNFSAEAGEFDSIEGLDFFEDVVMVEGGRITKTPRSCVATFIGAFGEIRKHFAGLRTARSAGFEPKDFSFNTRDGRCPDCEGRGKIIVDLQFLPDVSVVCERCRGTRFREAPLKHRYLGMNINDILELTVEKAVEIFKSKEKITSKLRILDDTGLGYLRLGQPLDTLSSGETSRLALARIIGKKKMQQRLFLFDEPSIGLHPFNISRLMRIFTRMIANGATIVCIEHNPEIIKSADYIIDMGPGGGEDGGRILATGTPEEIAGNSESVTGPYLNEYLVPEKNAPEGQTVYNGYPVTR
jgi:excinuclease ABC subunit A